MMASSEDGFEVEDGNGAGHKCDCGREQSQPDRALLPARVQGTPNDNLHQPCGDTSSRSIPARTPHRDRSTATSTPPRPAGRSALAALVDRRDRMALRRWRRSAECDRRKPERGDEHRNRCGAKSAGGEPGGVVGLKPGAHAAGSSGGGHHASRAHVAQGSAREPVPPAVTSCSLCRSRGGRSRGRRRASGRGG